VTGLAVTALTVAGALLLDLLPLPGLPAPWLLPAVLYRWAVDQPERLPPLVTFAAGIVADALGGLPLGVTATSLLLAQGLLRPRQRWLRRHGWAVAWLGFLAFVFLVTGLRWALLSLTGGSMPPLAPAAAEAGLSALVYPLVAGVLACLPRQDPGSAHAAAPG
jgi:rod shape-determining protein MreD